LETSRFCPSHQFPHGIRCVRWPATPSFRATQPQDADFRTENDKGRPEKAESGKQKMAPHKENKTNNAVWETFLVEFTEIVLLFVFQRKADFVESHTHRCNDLR